MTQGRFIREIHDDGGEIDGASHEQLVAMVQHTDPIAVMQVAQRLLAAANKMDEVSEELHAHMSGLDWEGAAADSFKNWGGQVSKSTMDLASYSRNAGEYMASAGETLATVKSGMPAVPHADMQTVSRYDDQPNDAVSTGGAILGGMIPGVGAGIGSWAAGKIADAVDSDWVTPAEAKAAQQRVNQAHNEAIQQMNKLAQAYQQSTMQLNSVQPPVFPPLPSDTTDRGNWSSVPVEVGGGTSGGTIRNPGGGTTLPHPPPRVGPTPTPRPPVPAPVPPAPVPPNPPQPPIPGPPHPPVPVPVPPAPVPPAPVPPAPTPWPPDPGTRIDHTPPAPTPPGPTVPGHGGGGGGGGIGGGGLGDVGGGSSGGGRGGGYQGGPIGGGPIGGGLGGGGATGTGRTGGGAPGTGGAAGAGGRAGGTTTAGGAGQTGQAGRAGTPGMGGMPHGGGGMGAGGAKGGAGGARGGGLVSRGGGTVGGQRGSASGRDVTPGGTGLRGRAERGADGRAGQGGFGGGHGGANRKGKPQGKRPDYLTEDEDTWTSGMGPVNPNVIE
ncbi:WXG100 family type VII secretion target [Kitasatospora sp. NPDC048407]|uniref:WXG100 family type VII secretion target n=1 Tax=Kitasatospora sp. NPDC048407 TaxID=3364051 RepID=UPI003713AA1F